MDINGVSFGDMKANFSNLKSIAFINEGIYGSVTPKTFEGIENIETIHIKDTNIESIDADSFQKLENIQGNTLSIFKYIDIFLTQLVSTK